MRLFIAACVFFLAVTSAQALVLTTFGSTASPTFTLVDQNPANFATQGPSSLTLNGADTLTFFNGTFPTVDIISGGEDPLILFLNGSVATNPASFFTITLFDSTFASTAIYEGGQWAEMAITGVTALTQTSVDAGFDYTQVAGLQLTTGGAGSALNATLTSLEVIPEPSSLFLLGAGALAAVARRRR